MLLQEFLKGKSHLAFVYRRGKKMLDPIREFEDCSDRETNQREGEQAEKKVTVKRKRTTSNLSASLNAAFLCTGARREVDLEEHAAEIEETRKLMADKSDSEDNNGIFLVTPDDQRWVIW